jgi:hypothetical protein
MALRAAPGTGAAGNDTIIAPSARIGTTPSALATALSAAAEPSM